MFNEPVQLSEMIDCEEETEEDGEDPEEVEDVMSVGSLDDGTRWFRHEVIRVGSQASAEEGGAQVDGDAGEPDHEESEEDALTAVIDQETDVFCGVFRSDRSTVEHCGEQTDLKNNDITNDDDHDDLTVETVARHRKAVSRTEHSGDTA